MSTVTYTLTNGETITIADTELNAGDFFSMVIDKGEDIDSTRVPGVQVESIHISYQFPKELRLTKD